MFSAGYGPRPVNQRKFYRHRPRNLLYGVPCSDNPQTAIAAMSTYLRPAGILGMLDIQRVKNALPARKNRCREYLDKKE